MRCKFWAWSAIIVLLLTVPACALFRSQEAATTGYVGDTTITARVKTALIKDPRIKASEIQVQTYQGKVTLNGVVDTAAMAERVLDVARATPGVRTINDKLKVANAPSVDGSNASSSSSEAI
jgi:hypothetical protein